MFCLNLLKRFLHAVPEKKDEELMQEELINGLAELYQSSQGPDNNRAKKRMVFLAFMCV